MKLSIGDYQTIFSIQELITKVKFDGTCWIWMGDYKGAETPTYTFRYDRMLMSTSPVRIFAALIMDRNIRLSDRKCKRKSCVNPGHYLI